MGLLEEINFFSDFDVKYFYPIYLVMLNVPSLIYEIFPFIFLLSSKIEAMWPSNPTPINAVSGTLFFLFLS